MKLRECYSTPPSALARGQLHANKEKVAHLQSDRASSLLIAWVFEMSLIAKKSYARQAMLEFKLIHGWHLLYFIILIKYISFSVMKNLERRAGGIAPGVEYLPSMCEAWVHPQHWGKKSERREAWKDR
jgi:hypothetical protein